MRRGMARPGVGARLRAMRRLPERCGSCNKQIATPETRILPDGTEKRGAEVTFRESAEGGISCLACAPGCPSRRQ